MPQSLSNVMVHLVFSTKNRVRLITPEVERGLHGFLAGIFEKCGSPALTIGGTEDHIHILCALSRTVTITDLVKTAKKRSSEWIKEQGREHAGFYWQSGYGSFSIGASGKAKAMQYIDTQKAHHRKIAFQDEFRALLKRYEIEYDERYVWD